MTDLKIGGENFRVEMTGAQERPVVVLIHALGADLSLWDAQMEPLLGHFRVVRYDLRGHGASAAASAALSVAQHGRDLLAILDILGVERAHVVGLSLGGAIAQWLLAFAPERVERTILAATAAHIGSPAIWNGRIAAVLSGGMPAIVDATMERWVSPDRPGATKLRDLLLATSPDGYAASCAALRDMDLTEALVSVRASVLVLTGTNDTAIASADTAKLLDVLSGARHVELDGRHILPVDSISFFNREMMRFLTAKLPTGRIRGQGRMPQAPATGREQPHRKMSPAQRARSETRQASRRSATTARKPLAPSPPKVPVARPRKSKNGRPAPTGASPPGKTEAKQALPIRTMKTTGMKAETSAGAKLVSRIAEPSAQTGTRDREQTSGRRRRSPPASASSDLGSQLTAMKAKGKTASGAVRPAGENKTPVSKPFRNSNRVGEQARANQERGESAIKPAMPTKGKAPASPATLAAALKAASRPRASRPRKPSKPRS